MPVKPIPYSPRVVVKFHDIAASSQSSVYDIDRYLNKAAQATLQKQFAGITFERLYKSVSPERIRKLALEAQRRDPTYRSAPNFLTYFAVRCPKGLKQASAVAATLNAQEWKSIVESAYVGETPTTDPIITNPDDNPERVLRSAETGYLRKAPKGIDADFAWEIENRYGIKGGDGGGPSVGLRFIDIEQAWMIQPNPDNLQNHEDLPTGIPIDGANYSQDGYAHGTAVLGIVVGMHNNSPTTANPNKGSLGITPHVHFTRVVSRWRYRNWDPTTNQWDHLFDTGDAIKYAVSDLLSRGGGTGDVLLLEAQTDYPMVYPRYRNVPIEVHEHVWHEIRQATALGIIVIEAAGNGVETNLDDLQHDTKGYMFDRANTHGTNEFSDSGAILVSAATSDVPHASIRIPDNSVSAHTWKRVGCYGSRIDCYAWGENIRTAHYGPSDPPYADFSGTSGAAAIVAGAALSVQGIYAENLNTRIPGVDWVNQDSPNMRQILSDPTRRTATDESTGATLSANSRYDANRNADMIGVMPNLRSIICNSLNIEPDR